MQSKNIQNTKKVWGDVYLGSLKALELLGKGLVVAAYVTIPGVAVAGKYLTDFNDWADSIEGKEAVNQLKPYDRSRLRQTFLRLRKKRDVKVVVENGVKMVRLTKQGRRRWLKYKIEKMKLDKSSWDGKWRLITYDIPEKKGKLIRKMLRNMLLRLECKQLHKSVYLTPYNCENEIDYLREVFGVGEDVVLMVISQIEGEEELKRDFGLE